VLNKALPEGPPVEGAGNTGYISLTPANYDQVEELTPPRPGRARLSIFCKIERK